MPGGIFDRTIDLDQHKTRGIICLLNEVEARHTRFLQTAAGIYHGRDLEFFDFVRLNVDKDMYNMHERVLDRSVASNCQHDTPFSTDETGQEVQMKEDRFLSGILIGIAVLIVAALAIFFTRQNQAAYVSDQTPEGVVHNYVLAVLKKDYQKAYGYLADLDNKPTFEEFRKAFAVGSLNPSNIGIKVGAADITGDDASVEVSTVNTPRDPFSEGYNNPGVAQLMRQNGAWKISSMPTYNLWDYSWYQAPPK
jgi:hypothetical protein